MAAILMPAYAQAREKARSVSCRSHLMQLGLSLHLYAQDHAGRFPPRDDQWGAVAPYLKNTQVYRCPSDAQLPTQIIGGQPVEVSYLYKGGYTNDDVGTLRVAWDRDFNHNNTSVNVLFLNGKTRSFTLKEWQTHGWKAYRRSTSGGMMGMGGWQWSATSKTPPAPPATGGGMGGMGGMGGDVGRTAAHEWRCFAMKRNSRSAFTFIELLIVTCIIVVLMAILFPVFAQAREKGRSSHCQSNLQQIGVALRMYYEDKGAYPPDKKTKRPHGFGAVVVTLRTGGKVTAAR